MVDEDKNISIDDRIARYLRGEMPQDEANEFLHDLKNREDMKDVLEQALATAYLAKAVKEVGEQQDAGIIAALKGIDTEAATEVANNASEKRKHRVDRFAACLSFGAATVACPSIDTEAATEVANKASEKRKHRIVKFAYALAAAASIAIIATVGYNQYERHQVIALGKEYALTLSPIAEEYHRGDTSTAGEEIIALTANVRNQENLEQTIDRLSRLWALSKSDTYNDYTDFAPEIGWTLAIAHLENNDKNAAISVLTQITALYPETAICHKANELLKKL
ncbi:MAG: hypothetical protein MR758_04410 [Bacteroidales bacterium]|nr:hypothetical protein [Bacteroidales bacterium]